MLATLIPFVVMFNIIPITVIGMIMTERNLKNDPALEKNSVKKKKKKGDFTNFSAMGDLEM